MNSELIGGREADRRLNDIQSFIQHDVWMPLNMLRSSASLFISHGDALPDDVLAHMREIERLSRGLIFNDLRGEIMGVGSLLAIRYGYAPPIIYDDPTIPLPTLGSWAQGRSLADVIAAIATKMRGDVWAIQEHLQYISAVSSADMTLDQREIASPLFTYSDQAICMIDALVADALLDWVQTYAPSTIV